MATHPRIQGFEVHIVVGDQKLDEYNNPEDEEELSANTTLKYIEVTTGAAFGFKISIGTAYPYKSDGLSLVFSIDGNKVDGIVWSSRVLKEKLPLSKTLDAMRVLEGRKWQEKPFSFADLSHDDAATMDATKLDEMKKQVKQMGELTITLQRVKTHGRGKAKSNTVPTGVSAIPEKALKGQSLTHSVSFNQARASARVRSVRVTKVGPEPLAIYAFRYRSRSALQSLLVIPRSPSPLPIEERDPETLTPEECIQVIRIMREQKAAAIRVKQEMKREHSDDDDEITLLQATNKRARTVANASNTIVLDDD